MGDLRKVLQRGMEREKTSLTLKMKENFLSKELRKL